MPVNDSLRSDAVRSGSLVVEAGRATPLANQGTPIACVTVWNGTGRSLGIGGEELDTDEHLAPGASYTSRVRDLSKVFVFQSGPGEARVRFTYEV